MRMSIAVLFASLSLLGLSGCGKLSALDASLVDASLQGQVPLDPDNINLGTDPAPVPGEYKVEQPALWETSPGPAMSTSRSWTTYSMSVVDLNGSSLMDSATDVTEFCPAYAQLNQMQRLNFWAYFVSSIVKYESGFRPTTRYQETTMGTDWITGEPVWSEGLMQLSYQDIRGYPFCEFNWSIDQALPRDDARKTILNPFKNLACGIRILNAQVNRAGKLVVGSGAYWAVLKSTNNNNKIAEIKALNQNIPMCKLP